MAINAVPALVRTCQHIRPFATRTVRDSPPLHCQKRRERVSACTAKLRHVCTALRGCWKRVQLHVVFVRATCSNLNLYTKAIVSGETNSCVFVKTRRRAGKLDLFNDAHYEQLLRISFSGIVWFACASPPCGDFSTIKLRPGPGPRPIRTREYPLGIPDATAAQSARIRRSLCLLERAVALLLAVFQAGGHVSLEQPPNALSWRQAMVQHYLLEVSASCCCVAACAYGLNIHKRWMFATSFAGLSALACVCERGRSALTWLASGWKMARILVVAQQSILLLWPQLSYNL